MAIYTPRGLKIRYSVREAFLFLSRIYPEVSPFKFLQDVEAYENFPVFCGVIAMITCLVLKLSPLMLFGVVTGVRLVTALLRYFNLMILVPMKILLPILRIYGLLSGHGVIVIPIITVAYFIGGWMLSVSVLASIFVSCVIELCMDRVFYTHSVKIGIPRFSSELSFDQAFEYYCRKTGAPTDGLSDDERCSENWLEPLRDLAMSWPIVVSRFDFSNDTELIDRLNEVL